MKEKTLAGLSGIRLHHKPVIYCFTIFNNEGVI